MNHIRKHHLRTERWKDVKGYEGLYKVSNFGKVRSLDHYVKTRGEGLRISKGRMLSQAINKYGYAVVVLCKNSITKNYRVNRLVAEAFKPNPHNYPTVDHINRIRTDNRSENLRWAPYELQQKNVDRESQRKKAKEKLQNRKDLSKPVCQYTLDMVFIKEYPSIREASRMTKINHECIRRCCNGNKNYSHAGGYIWKYKELTDTL